MTGTYKPDLEKASLEAYLSKPQKYARVEGERRFWLKSLPEDLDRDAFVRIIDRYIPGTRLRLRLIESPSGEPLAFKFGQKYRARHLESHQTLMTNIYLDEVEYRILARLGGATVIKRRYPYQHAGGIYSLDVFEGHLEGLILLEIESQGEADIGLAAGAVHCAQGGDRRSILFRWRVGGGFERGV